MAAKKRKAGGDLAYIAEALRPLAVPIDELHPNPDNANTHGPLSIEAIAGALDRFGQRKPVVVRRSGMTVTAGNGTLEAARRLGWAMLAAVVCDDPEDVATAYGLADNQVGTFSEIDEAKVAELTATMAEDLREATGWSAEELAEFAAPAEASTEPGEPEADPADQIPEPPADPITELGDVWHLGRHRLLCGDATIALLGFASAVAFDALVTDPPYSSGGQFRSDRTKDTKRKYVQHGTKAKRTDFGGDSRDQRAFLAWSTAWLTTAFGVSKPGALAAIFTDWRQLPTVTDAVQSAGWIWRNLVTWWKPGIRMQRGRFSLSAEYLVIGSNGKPEPGPESPQNVLELGPVKGEGKAHIAEKPVELLATILGTAAAGGAILDPFVGSGTTLLAADRTDRICYAIERDPAYCDVTVQRWEAMSGKKAKRKPAK